MDDALRNFADEIASMDEHERAEFFDTVEHGLLVYNRGRIAHYRGRDGAYAPIPSGLSVLMQIPIGIEHDADMFPLGNEVDALAVLHGHPDMIARSSDCPALRRLAQLVPGLADAVNDRIAALRDGGRR